jgi:hypothetical protein
MGAQHTARRVGVLRAATKAAPGLLQMSQVVSLRGAAWCCVVLRGVA